MFKITLELDTKQVDKIVESLSIGEKLRLVRRLEKETLHKRWDEIFKDIDKRLKKFPISKKEIVEEIAAYRREKNAQSHN